MSIFTHGLLRIRFEATEESIENQVQKCGLTLDKIAALQFQEQENWIRKLMGHGLMTYSESHNVRRRLVKQIAGAVNPVQPR